MARPGGARQPFAEVLLQVGFRGIKEAVSSGDVFTRAVTKIQDAYRTTTREANNYAWSSVRISDQQAQLTPRLLEATFLFDQHRQTLKEVYEGQLKIADLSKDQVETFRETLKVQSELLKQDLRRPELNAAQREAYEARQKVLLEVNRRMDKLEDVTELVDEGFNKLQQTMGGLFGGMISGSQDATKVFGALSDGIKTTTSLLQPLLDKLKKGFIEAMVPLQGGEVTKGKAMSWVEDMITGLTGDVEKGRQAAQSAMRENTQAMAEAINHDPIQLFDDVNALKNTEATIAKRVGGIKNAIAPATKQVQGMTQAMAATEPAAATMAVSATRAGAATTQMAGSAAAASGETTALASSAAAAAGPLVILAVAVGAAYAGFKLLAEGLRLNIEYMEEFRQVGYRAAGSIQELIGATADLSMALGVTVGDSVKTIKALSHAGFQVRSLKEQVYSLERGWLSSKDTLLEVAKANLAFADSTGAAAESVARLQKRLVVMQYTLEDQRAILGTLAVGAARYGLTGDELNSIIGTLVKNSVALETIWSGTNISSFTVEVTRLAGAAKKLGLEMTIVSQILDDVNSASERSLKLAAMGGGLRAFFGNDAEAQIKATAAGAERILATADKMSGVMKQRYLERFGGPEYLKTLVQYNKDLAQLSDAEKDRAKQAAEAREKLNQAFASASGTLSRSLERMFAPVIALFMKIGTPIINMLVEVIQYLTPIMDSVVELGESIAQAFGAIFGPFMPAIKAVYKVMGAMILGPMKMVIDVLASLFKVVALGATQLHVLLAPVVSLVERIGQLFSDLMSWSTGLFSSVRDWLNSMIDPMYEWVQWAKDLADGFWGVKKALFGSSMFHIKEGISEVLPSIGKLFSAWELVSTPFRWIRDAIGSAIQQAVKLVSILANPFKLVKTAADAIKTLFAEDAEAVAKVSMENADLTPLAREVKLYQADLESKPQTADEVAQMYTVKFAEDIDEEEVRNSTMMTAHLGQISYLMRNLVSKEDQNVKRSAELLEQILEKMKKSDDQSRWIDHGKSKSGFGERINGWW